MQWGVMHLSQGQPCTDCCSMHITPHWPSKLTMHQLDARSTRATYPSQTSLLVKQGYFTALIILGACAIHACSCLRSCQPCYHLASASPPARWTHYPLVCSRKSRMQRLHSPMSRLWPTAACCFGHAPRMLPDWPASSAGRACSPWLPAFPIRTPVGASQNAPLPTLRHHMHLPLCNAKVRDRDQSISAIKQHWRDLLQL